MQCWGANFWGYQPFRGQIGGPPKREKRAGKRNFWRDVSAMRSPLSLWLAAWIWPLCAGTSALTNQKQEFRSRSAMESWLVGALVASRSAWLVSTNWRLSWLHMDEFYKKMKSLPNKSTLIFPHKCMGASYKHFYIFFVIPLWRHVRHTTPAPILL